MVNSGLLRLEVTGGELEAVVFPPTSSAGSPHPLRPPLVFLHEGLGAISMWRDFPARVHDACHAPATLVYSRHGYGNSAAPTRPRPVTYMHHDARVVLPEVLTATGLVNPLIVGHSDGASIALLHAATSPVAGLVLIAPHVFVEAVTINAIRDAKKQYEVADLRSRLAKHHRDVDAAFLGWNDVWLSAEFAEWNIESCLTAIQCPVLLVQGDADPYGTLAQLDAIEAGVTGEVKRVVLEGVKHAPHLEASDATRAAITLFYEECL